MQLYTVHIGKFKLGKNLGVDLHAFSLGGDSWGTQPGFAFFGLSIQGCPCCKVDIGQNGWPPRSQETTGDSLLMTLTISRKGSTKKNRESQTTAEKMEMSKDLKTSENP